MQSSAGIIITSSSGSSTWLIMAACGNSGNGSVAALMGVAGWHGTTVVLRNMPLQSASSSWFFTIRLLRTDLKS